MSQTILETDKIKIASFSGGKDRGTMINMIVYQNEFDKTEVFDILTTLNEWIEDQE